MKQVIFICESCIYKNRMETGVDGYEQRQTEFESFTEAVIHAMKNNNRHEMTAIIKEE